MPAAYTSSTLLKRIKSKDNFEADLDISLYFSQEFLQQGLQGKKEISSEVCLVFSGSNILNWRHLYKREMIQNK